MYQQQLTTHSEVDQLIDYYQDRDGKVVLSEKLEKLHSRLIFAAGFLGKWPMMKVVTMLMKEYGYSMATAYRDCQDADYFFGATTVQNRALRIERLLEKINKTYDSAMIKQDFKSAALCLREEKEVLVKLLPDKEALPYDKIIPPRFILGFYPETQHVPLPDDWEVVVERLTKSKLKKQLQIEDIDFTEEKNDAPGERAD